MPSPKAVLRDIHDLKLDPRHPHSAIRHTGRLRVPVTGVLVVEPVIKPIVVAEAKPQVIVEPPVVVSKASETVIVEPVKKDEPEAKPEAKKEEKPVEKPAKKADKKEEKKVEEQKEPVKAS